jgi:hypothetical protein
MEGQTGLAQLFFPSRETILAVLPTLGITSAGGEPPWQYIPTT